MSFQDAIATSARAPAPAATPVANAPYLQISAPVTWLGMGTLTDIIVR